MKWAVFFRKVVAALNARNNKMNAVILDINLLPGELEAMGLSGQDIAELSKNILSRAVKLCSITPFTKTIIENLVAAGNGKAVFLPAGENSANLVDAVVVASDQELAAVGKQLEALEGNPAELGRLLNRALKWSQASPDGSLRLGAHTLPLGQRTLIMGILNVTPDSFSDGGRFNRLEKALEQAYRMADEGADIIDIGGESTRPGSVPVPADEELNRVMPVIEALKKEHSFTLPLSIDTYKAAVAEKALEAGVEMINDVWGLKKDRDIGKVAARHRVPLCLMHNRRSTEYTDLIPDIISEMVESLELAHSAGVEDRQIIIDPGIGFGKDLKQNLEVMRHLREFCSLGYPLLLGTSRKSMIGKTLELPADDRIEGTAATVAYGISAGADIIRVHDVLQMRRVAVMTDAMVRR